MLTLNTILEEIKEVPVSRLEELYQFVHALTPQPKKTEVLRKKILSFGGAFSDMSSKEYASFVNHTKKTRANLFDRKVTL
jgi:predicted flavoprotein YhiN